MTFKAQADTAILNKTARRAVIALACAVLAGLGGCSGDGNGGTDVTIGSGQGGDPVTLDFPVFYVKRPVPEVDADNDVTDARELRRFEPGADLYMRSSASPSSPAVNLTAEMTNGKADIRDVDVSFDGQKVVFAMRVAGANQDVDDVEPEDDLPSWNIWEYDVATKALRRVIASDTIENDGHDIMPHYLPDGRIAFSSTRWRTAKAIQLAEGKPQYAGQVEGIGGKRPAFVLHVMDDDGTNIKQISFNQAHDLDPEVLANGQIIFTRWERAIDDDQMDLYRVNPDGSGLELLYGANSHATGSLNPTTNQPTTVQFLSPRPMQDGRTLTLVRPFDGTNEGGDLVLIDTGNFVDCNQTVPTTTVTATPPCTAQARALPTDVRTTPGPSPGGRFLSAAPLFDGSNRLLVSWSQCRFIEDGRTVPCTADRLDRFDPANPALTEAPPLYGVYIYDVRSNTQLPIVAPEEGFIYTEVAAGSNRALPPVILDKVAGVDFPAALGDEAVGILDIRSVYDIDGVDRAPGTIPSVRNPATADFTNRTARFLRLEKVVSLPDNEQFENIPNTAFGRGGRRFGMRDILGYAPIEPDGSVKVKVPANVPFTISILDRNGRRLGGNSPLAALHTNWLQVGIGETLQCTGCHAQPANATTPGLAHGRKGLTASVNPGAPMTSAPFPNAHPALVANDLRETMADVRGRVMCGGACKPSMNLIVNEPWTVTPPAARPDACYETGATDVAIDPARPPSADPTDATRRHVCATRLTTPSPLSNAACSGIWRSSCRVTINYPEHIHPLWSSMGTVDANEDGVADMDPVTMMPKQRQCIACHAPTVNASNVPVIPAGDLDLRDGPSEDEADHLASYRELLFNDNGQVVNAMNQIEDECIARDPVTQVCTAFRQVQASMSFNGAAASGRFFTKFDAGGGTVDHRGFLTRAELKLIAEWLDIGAQYYNNPFDVPED
jgi:hypothetical protein